MAKSQSQSNSTAVTAPASPWIYGPWLDLLVGCGAWSAPLLAVAMWLTPVHPHAWVVGFYLLAIIFNYPHFMATIYRAYHTREDFEKYKMFTLHVTLLLVLTGILLHASYRFLPWVFTLYICWSPWHYTGQNYGLLMMFARRSGATVTQAERRWLRAAFVASYLMLLASFETGGSSDSLILSLGLPARVTLPARVILGAAFAIFAFLGFRRLVSRAGVSAMTAPLTLLLTQFLWFVLPTLVELRSQYQIPQTRYSSGILAVLHSAQYIWITSYYQQREARAKSKSGWRMTAYLLTLLAGGIALFIPGPWLVSYLFHYDFTTSFLIFTALVNIHHFILDGAIWKLRDSRISSVLVDRSKAPAQAATENAMRTDARGGRPWAASRVLSAPAFRISVAGLLFLWGGIDQVHFALGSDEGDLASLQRAADMNPYDSMLQARIASAETQAGERDEAVAALTRAVEISPQNAALQHACARAMIEDGRYEDAYEHYGKMLAVFPNDADALVNYGLLAKRLGHPEEAVSSWEKAVGTNPNQPNAQLYLAEALDQKGQPGAAAPHWNAFLQLASAHPDDPVASATQQISAAIQLGDDETRSNDEPAALTEYKSAISMAERANDSRLESLAFAHLADLQEKTGDSKSAALSYERGLALDAKAADSRSEAFDWFNYGQFLRRHGLPDELAYACFLRAQNLLGEAGGQEIETVRAAVRDLSSHLGKKASVSAEDLPELLSRAANLPTSSF
jgi:tetratricopeptide (TPR) repeat protein